MNSNKMLVYHTESNRQTILSSNPTPIPLKIIRKVQPVFRNKLWLSNGGSCTLKRMDAKHLYIAIDILRSNKGRSFQVEEIATLKDLESELNYRKNLIDRMFKHMHIYDIFKYRQYEPCRFLGSNLTTKGVEVI